MNCVIEQEPSEIKAQSIATLTLSDKEGAVQRTDVKTIRTTCPYCGVGCGVLATVNKDTGVVSVKGDPEHPANFGKLCSKGSALAETLGTERRITQPYYNQSYYYKKTRGDTPIGSNSPPTQSQINLVESTTTPADWDVVLDDIATRLNDTIAEHGRDSVMFYVSGQLLTEDYYVANKFIKGFIGNNNIDSNSRLCMSSAVAGHKRAFGADLVPGNYEDLEACELLVLVGSNMAWCHPILFGRFLKAKQANPDIKLVVIDPRRTDSCEFADLHLPIAAGTDTHLYNGLLNYLEQQDCRDTEYSAQCGGLDEALSAAKDWSIEAVAEACQVDAEAIRRFYQLVAKTPKTVTAFSMGVNQSSSGTDKVNAIINTHLLTGRVGKVGASPFSLTGQPNAMGGREVGALANLLAAHLDLDNAGHRQAVADFWQAPQSIGADHGVKACDAADAILDGRIKAIWIMATNPVVSLPEADKFRRALSACDLVIVSDCSKDSDTVDCADIVLPAQGWGEKSGTVTNSERRISRQRSLLPPVGEAKPDWWILSQVAQRMGLDGFDYSHPSEIFNEHVALTAWQNHDETADHISGMDQGIPRYLNLAKDLANFTAKPTVDRAGKLLLNAVDYDALPPFQWGGSRINIIDETCKTTRAQLISISPPGNASTANFHQTKFKRNPLKRHLPDSSGAVSSLEAPHSSETLSKSSEDANDLTATINLRLITGRLRDQWHTMTRTGLAPQLNQQQSMPTLTLHPIDAQQLGVSDQDFVQIDPRYEGIEGNELLQTNPSASHVMAQVDISDTMRVGDAFMPMHWSDAFASLARVGTLIPTVVDPHSSQPELKNSAIRVTPLRMQSVGKVLVHPDWQDAMVVQLRTLLAKFSSESDTHSVSEQSGLPALTWSLSRQKDSVLFNIASPLEQVCSTWLEPEFWQQWLEALPLERSANRKQIQTDPNTATSTATIQSREMREIDAPPLSTAFMVNEHRGQLRFIATQAAKQIETAQTEAIQTSLDTEATDNSDDKSLVFAVFIAPSQPQLPSSHWLDSCFADISQVPSVKWLLAGRPATGYIDPGPLVCACMSVGENIIINAITEHACHSAVAVGKQCRAGTNCGSCVGQINELIAEYA